MDTKSLFYDDIIRLYESGMSRTNISKKLGCHIVTVSVNLKKAGFKQSRRSPKIVPVEKMIELRKTGMPVSEVADKVGVHEGTVAYKLKDAGYVHKLHRLEYGTPMHEIVDLYLYGITATGISKMYGCKYNRIVHILKHKKVYTGKIINVDKIIAGRNMGMNRQQIGIYAGCGEYSVGRVLREHKMPRRPSIKSRMILPENQVADLYNYGFCLYELEGMYGVHIQAIKSALKKNDTQIAQGRTPIRIPIYQIKSLLEYGFNNVEVSKLYGCSPPTIRNKLKRHTNET